MTLIVPNKPIGSYVPMMILRETISIELEPPCKNINIPPTCTNLAGSVYFFITYLVLLTLKDENFKVVSLQSPFSTMKSFFFPFLLHIPNHSGQR